MSAVDNKSLAPQQRCDALDAISKCRCGERPGPRLSNGFGSPLADFGEELCGPYLPSHQGARWQQSAGSLRQRGFQGSTQLASGRFAMIGNGLGFSLVPWRPVLENKMGHEATGVMRGEDSSWQFGRGTTLGVGV
jgi:Protein of unknown function (DUF3363)